MEQTSGAEAVFLPERLMENCGYKADLAREVLADFQHATPGRLSRLAAAVAVEDPVQVRFEAHALSGGCHAIGAEALAAMCAQMERAGKKRDLSDAPALLIEIERQIPLLNDVLAVYLGHSRP